MSTRIHICNSDADADIIIAVEKTNSGDQNLPVQKKSDSDIIIMDHSQNVAHPTFLNQNKICVVCDY